MIIQSSPTSLPAHLVFCAWLNSSTTLITLCVHAFLFLHSWLCSLLASDTSQRPTPSLAQRRERSKITLVVPLHRDASLVVSLLCQVQGAVYVYMYYYMCIVQVHVNSIVLTLCTHCHAMATTIYLHSFFPVTYPCPPFR